jgi:hypothetical protein
MAVMPIRRMDSVVMPGSRSRGPTDRIALLPIDRLYRFTTGCTVQRCHRPAFQLATLGEARCLSTRSSRAGEGFSCT